VFVRKRASGKKKAIELLATMRERRVRRNNYSYNAAIWKIVGSNHHRMLFTSLMFRVRCSFYAILKISLLLHLRKTQASC